MLATLLGLLRRIPWWAWVVLLIGGTFLVHEWRLNRTVAALRAEVQANQERGIREAQDAAKKSIADYSTQATQLAATVRALQAQAQAAAAKSAALTEKLAVQDKARVDLIEHGTVDDIVKAGQALGYHPVPAVRP